MNRFLIIALPILLAVSGCASTSFKPKIKLKDPLADTFDFEHAADDMPWAAAKDVTVFSGELPKGVTIREGKATFSSDFEYEILGLVYTETKGGWGEGWHTSPMYFYDYSEDEVWRKPYCYWQVPLTWATLGLWIGIPTYYPCLTIDTNKEGDIRNRRNRIVNTLKKAAKALGGTHLLFVGQEPVSIVSTNGVIYWPAGSSVGVFSSTQDTKKYDWGTAWGFALKRADTSKKLGPSGQ